MRPICLLVLALLLRGDERKARVEAASAAAQDPAATKAPAEEPLDRVTLADRTELQGEITGYEAAGRLRFRSRESGVPLTIAIEEITRLQFNKEEPIKPDPQAEQARLYPGGVLSGRVRSFEGKVAVIESPAGTFRLQRSDLKALILGPLSGPLPEIKEERLDIIIREIEKKEEGKEKAAREMKVDYGRLQSIGEKVVFRVVSEKKEGEGAPVRQEEAREFERARVKHIYFHREGPAPELPPGWFCKVLLKNGDKIVGVVESFSRDKLRLFSHLLGVAEIDKKRIHSMVFVPQARMTVGNVLICDQGGVRELDRTGREIWSYGETAQYAWSARKLENGNVLIANTNYNQVIEVTPNPKSGGKIAWQIDQSNYPYDAVRLENGNTLVAEYYSNRVVEYDAKTKNVTWQCGVNYPISVQRLDNGNTLICSNQQVLEVDREARPKWQANLGGVRPWRAQRLENGNTLVTDYQRGQVVEFDRESNKVWTQPNLSRPVQAIRLEDGNTLILEQGNNRVIEVDPSNPRQIIERIKGLNYPQGMSTY